MGFVMSVHGSVQCQEGRDKTFLSIHWCLDVAKHAGWILDTALGHMV